MARFTPDLSRFASSVRAIVRGLYYHEFRFTKKLPASEIQVFWLHLRNDEGEPSPEYMAIHDWAHQRLPPPDRGANPQVFQYRFDPLPDGEKQMCRLRFYEGVPVYSVWKEDAEAAKHARIGKAVAS